MGKNYSEDTYKKTYSDEYIKSYALNRAQQSLYNESVAEYNNVSKKIGTRTYTKNEKAVYTGLQPSVVDPSNVVRAEGRERVTKRSTTTITPQQEKKTKNPIKKNITLNQEKGQTRTENTPPPYIPTETSNKKPSNDRNQENQHTYSYIEMDALTNPVIRLADGSYFNTYTEKEVPGDEARRILEYAGYTIKRRIPIKQLFFISLFTIPIKILAPIALILWGIWIIIKPTVIVQKKQSGHYLQVLAIANNLDKIKNKNRGIFIIIIGFFIGFIQLIIYS